MGYGRGLTIWSPKRKPDMTKLTKQLFNKLADTHEGRCLSIYMPTHVAGQEVLHHEDQLLLKNLIKRTETVLETRGYDKSSIKDFFRPLQDLLHDIDFWRYRTEGLAIFLAPGQLQSYDLPYSVKSRHYLAHEYYLRPLLPVIQNQPHYHVLSLNLQEIKCYRGEGEEFGEVMLPGLPQSVEEVMGTDYQESSISFHRQKMGGHSYTIYHGKGEWQEDQKDEVMTLFRSVDHLLQPILELDKWPLLVVAPPELFSVYREVNTYRFMHPDPIALDPRYASVKTIIDRSQTVLDSIYLKARDTKADLIRRFQNTGRTAVSWENLIPDAVAGKVDTLFLDMEAEIWGIYDKSTTEVRIHEYPNLTNTSLTNLAATQVFLQGGTVYETTLNEMPLPGYQLNALMRY